MQRRTVMVARVGVIVTFVLGACGTTQSPSPGQSEGVGPSASASASVLASPSPAPAPVAYDPEAVLRRLGAEPHLVVRAGTMGGEIVIGGD
ncbi:MAG: hypothetical protein ACRDHD_10545 [Candidatus Limnocylindria bacterium]